MIKENEHAWDRQPGESSKAYANFCRYRDAGEDRSLRKLAGDAKTTSNLRQLQEWSSRWRWVERSQKYEDHLEHQARLLQEKEFVEIRKRHTRIAALTQNILLLGVESQLAKAQLGGPPMTVADLKLLMDVTVKAEQQARSEPTEGHKASEPAPARPKLSREQTLRKVAEAYGINQDACSERTHGPGGGSGTSQSQDPNQARSNDNKSSP